MGEYEVDFDNTKQLVNLFPELKDLLETDDQNYDALLVNEQAIQMEPRVPTSACPLQALSLTQTSTIMGHISTMLHTNLDGVKALIAQEVQKATSFSYEMGRQQGLNTAIASRIQGPIIYS